MKRLQQLSWDEAAGCLTPDTVVVIPLGAALKEHGMHLPLDTDLHLAEWLVDHLPDLPNSVATATVNYFHYPAFIDYPGSTNLSLETSTQLICDLVRSLAAHGPRRFYVLNTGLSTVRALIPASGALAAESIALRWTDIETVAADVEKQLSEQEAGSHADELETSMMMVIAPEQVRLHKAKRDIGAGQGTFSRTPMAGRRHSPTGAFGDPTLADPTKGRLVLEAWLKGIERDIWRMLEGI